MTFSIYCLCCCSHGTSCGSIFCQTWETTSTVMCIVGLNVIPMLYIYFIIFVSSEKNFSIFLDFFFRRESRRKGRDHEIPLIFHILERHRETLL
jgi:hypothetical protein